MIKKIAITTMLASTFLFGAQTVVETEKNNNDTKITKTTVVTGSHTTLPGRKCKRPNYPSSHSTSISKRLPRGC